MLRSVACFVAAVLALAPAVAASAAEPLGGSDQLVTARERLSGAQRELQELEAAVQRANDEVAALDARLTDATTELAAVEVELRHARALAASAAGRERATTAEYTRATRALEDSVVAWKRHREQLNDRVVHAFKHGRAATPDLLLRGVRGAEGLHEVAVTLEIVGRLAAHDRWLLETSVGTTREQAEAHARLATLRAEALGAARAAFDEASRVEDLLARHERLVTEAVVTRDRRRAVLAAFEADAAARAVLVRSLEDRVADLSLTSDRGFVPIEVDLDPFGAPPPWATGLPGAGPTWSAAIAATAARHGLDARLLTALVWTESNFRADAVSSAGALGLAQLMPGTARGLGVDPRDPLANLDGGARYLRIQLERFGRIDLALAAYNAGPGRVARAAGIPPIVETQLYVVRVLDRFERLSERGPTPGTTGASR